MMSRKDRLSRLLAAVGMTAVLAVGAVTPSLAATTHRHYRADAYNARAYDARGSFVQPRAEQRQWNGGGGYFAHGAPDDPPGSAFQTFGNDRSMGGVR
jgi:hypothetical protein